MRAFKSLTLLVLTMRLLLRLRVFFTVRERQPSKPVFISTPYCVLMSCFLPTASTSQHLGPANPSLVRALSPLKSKYITFVRLLK